MAKPAHVVICIVGFRNAGDIVECLEAVGRLTHQDFEVVVWENGGAAAFEALRAALPARLPAGQPIELIQSPGNIGYAGGVNGCIRARPDADAWWVLNPDAAPAPDALSRLLDRLSDGFDAVGGTLHYPDGRVQAHGGRWRPWFSRPESIGRGSDVSSLPNSGEIEREMNYLLGASMLIGRSFVDGVGLMREDYFLYCEEVEWCLRAVGKGLRLGFAPGAFVLHRQGSTTGSGKAATARPRLPVYLDERNKLLVTRDIFPSRLPIAAPAALLLALVRYGKRGSLRQVSYAVTGWWAGLRNERGKPGWVGE